MGATPNLSLLNQTILESKIFKEQPAKNAEVQREEMLQHKLDSDSAENTILDRIERIEERLGRLETQNESIKDMLETIIIAVKNTDPRTPIEKMMKNESQQITSIPVTEEHKKTLAC